MNKPNNLQEQIQSLLKLEDTLYIDVIDHFIETSKEFGSNTEHLELGKKFLIDNPSSKQVLDRLRAKFDDDLIRGYINIVKSETFVDIQNTIDDALLEVALTLQDLMLPPEENTNVH